MAARKRSNAAKKKAVKKSPTRGNRGGAGGNKDNEPRRGIVRFKPSPEKFLQELKAKRPTSGKWHVRLEILDDDDDG